jgi:hypothetical protein
MKMYQTEVVWKDRSVEIHFGPHKIIDMVISDRMGYGNRRTARNLAVRTTMYPFFASYCYDPNIARSWKEALSILKLFGATEDEITKFGKMGVSIGWGDIPELALFNGQKTMF